MLLRGGDGWFQLGGPPGCGGGGGVAFQLVDWKYCGAGVGGFAGTHPGWPAGVGCCCGPELYGLAYAGVGGVNDGVMGAAGGGVVTCAVGVGWSTPGPGKVDS